MSHSTKQDARQVDNVNMQNETASMLQEYATCAWKLKAKRSNTTTQRL
jgi:hypothetical protein